MTEEVKSCPCEQIREMKQKNRSVTARKWRKMTDELEGQIINADCLDILRELPDKCVDLVLTDPPYGINIAERFAKRGQRDKNKKSGKAKWSEWRSADWDKSTPPRAVFDEIFRVSKNQIIFGGNYFAEYLPNSPCWLVWDKLNTGEFADAELAFTSFKSPVRIYPFLWNGMLQQNMKKKKNEYTRHKSLLTYSGKSYGTTATTVRLSLTRLAVREQRL